MNFRPFAAPPRATSPRTGEAFAVRLSFLALFLRSQPHSPPHICHLPCCYLSSVVLLTKEDLPFTHAQPDSSDSSDYFPRIILAKPPERHDHNVMDPRRATQVSAFLPGQRPYDPKLGINSRFCP